MSEQSENSLEVVDSSPASAPLESIDLGPGAKFPLVRCLRRPTPNASDAVSALHLTAELNRAGIGSRKAHRAAYALLQRSHLNVRRGCCSVL